NVVFDVHLQVALDLPVKLAIPVLFSKQAAEPHHPSAKSPHWHLLLVPNMTRFARSRFWLITRISFYFEDAITGTKVSGQPAFRTQKARQDCAHLLPFLCFFCDLLFARARQLV